MDHNDLYHPVANIFPLMKGEAFDAFCSDIAANGLHEDIWRHDGKIIDGRNRYLACLEAGISPRFREWDGKGDLVAFVLSLNLHRRHLNESQRAMVAAKIANLSNGQHKGSSIDLAQISQGDAAKMLNVSAASVKRAKIVKDKGTPQLIEAVERGDVSVGAGVYLAEVEAETQKKSIAEGPEAVRQEVRKVRAGRAKKRGTADTKLDLESAPKAGVRMGAIATMIGELSELVNRPDHRYPFIQIKKKVSEISEAFSRIVGQNNKRTA